MKNAALLLCLALSVVACKNVKINEYVAESVKLEPVRSDSDELRGTVTFKHTTYWTASREVCDTYICGYDYYPSCHYVTRCHGGGRHHRNCWSERVCHTRSVPRYCRTNCRMEPYETSNTEKTTSPVVLKLVGMTGGSDSKVNNVYVGLATNGKFQEAVKNPSVRPKNSDAVFNALKVDDKNVLVLKAKGYKLTEGQDFLKLPAGFKAGDLVELEARVEKTGDGKDTFSATGTKQEFPPLHTSSRR